MMRIVANQISVTKKEFLRALNRQMDFFKWLFLAALVSIPLGISSGEAGSEIIAMVGAAFVLFLLNLGSSIMKRLAVSAKDSSGFFGPRTYTISDDEISIEYSNQQKATFYKADKLKVKRKIKHFTLSDKDKKFEIIPMNVFSTDEEKAAFMDLYSKKKKKKKED